MTEPVVMDYGGKPVSIEEGQMLWWDAEDGTHWNSQTLQFEEDDEEDYIDDEPDWDRIPYGWRGNPYRQCKGAWAEEAEYFYSGL